MAGRIPDERTSRFQRIPNRGETKPLKVLPVGGRKLRDTVGHQRETDPVVDALKPIVLPQDRTQPPTTHASISSATRPRNPFLAAMGTPSHLPPLTER